MTGQRCCVCNNNRAKDPAVSFHRIPRNKATRAKGASTNFTLNVIVTLKGGGGGVFGK